MVEPMEGHGDVNEVQENPVEAQVENQARAELVDVAVNAVPEPGLDGNQNNAQEDENKANDGSSISDITKRGLFLIEDMKQLVMLMHKRRQQGDAVLELMPNSELFALAKRSTQSRSGRKSSKRLKRKRVN